MCSAVARGSPGHLPDELPALVFEVWGTPSFAERLAKEPQHFRLYCAIYASLRSLGLADPTSGALARDLVAQGYVTAREEVPFRRMELRYLLDLAGLEHELPSQEELYGQTLLAHPVAACAMTPTDAYAATHAIFYLSDFGLRAPTWRTRDEEARVTTQVTLLAARFVAERHWDLAGELLLCLCVLPGADPELVRFVTAALAAAQNRDGSVAGPSRSGAVGVTQSDADERGDRFAGDYHTTLVASLAAQAILRRNDPHLEPPASRLGAPRLMRTGRLTAGLARCARFVEGGPAAAQALSATASSLLLTVLEPSPARWCAVRRASERAGRATADEIASSTPTVALVAGEIARRYARPVPALDDYARANLAAVRVPPHRDGPPDFSFTTSHELRRAASGYLATPDAASEVPIREKWLVTGHALSLLYRRNVEVASLLSRVLVRWDWRPNGFANETLGGFLACQHPHGYFGFDRSLLEQAGEPVPGPIADGARATTTLVALWAMAEIAVPGFLLLDPGTWPEAD